MKRKYYRFVSLLAAVMLTLGSMSGALAVSGSTAQEVAPGTTTFTYTLEIDPIVEEYASAQFDITIGNDDKSGLDIDSITFSNDFRTASQVTSSKAINGFEIEYQTGFISTANQFENTTTKPMCTITFSYTGSSAATVTFDNLKVWRLTDAGGGNLSIDEDAITGWSRLLTVTRGDELASPGGTSGDTNNGGTNGGGTSNNGTSDNNDGGDDDQGILGEKTIDFNDVQEGDWFYDAVEYAVDAGLFNGTSETTFDPNTPMTRAMFVTILYRLAGSPAVSGTNTFGDVASGEWYTDAVLWASENGVVTGYDSTTFGTNDIMTREQLVTMLYRYAEGRGYDVGQSGNLQAFTDASSISSYALEALQWAYAADIIHGRTATTLVPQGSATRAECAKLMMDFMENFVL